MWALATKQHKGHDNKYIFFIHFQGLNVALGLSILLAYNDLRLKEVGDFEVQTFFWKPHFKCKTNFH
jgi:hypothetical protein